MGTGFLGRLAGALGLGSTRAVVEAQTPGEPSWPLGTVSLLPSDGTPPTRGLLPLDRARPTKGTMEKLAEALERRGIVLECMICGGLAEELGDELGLSPDTVRTSVSHLRHQAGVRAPTGSPGTALDKYKGPELVAWALAQRGLDPLRQISWRVKQEVAEELGLSSSTVGSYVSYVRRDLRGRARAAANEEQ